MKDALLDIITATITPISPIASPKISITKHFTKSDESAASAFAIAAPNLPTQKPAPMLENPMITPEKNCAYAAL